MFWPATNQECLHVRVSSLRDVVGAGRSGGTTSWLCVSGYVGTLV